jgi:hypothetical protein
LGANDESIGRGTDEVERMAGDQREDLMRIGIQNRDIGGVHDFRGYDAVLKLALQRGEDDHVILPDVLQRKKQCVPVPSDSNVARHSGELRPFNVSGGSTERSFGGSLGDGYR